MKFAFWSILAELLRTRRAIFFLSPTLQPLLSLLYPLTWALVRDTCRTCWSTRTFNWLVSYCGFSSYNPVVAFSL